MKRLLLGTAGVLARLWAVLPGRLRRRLLFGLFVLEGRSGPPADGLRALFGVLDDLDLAINERAMAYGGGLHPKHRLMAYHDFFVDHIAEGSRVLDLGCGQGAVAASIAERVPGSRVLGMDVEADRIAEAQARYDLPNLDFQVGDALRQLPADGADVVVLSNVLEHIDQRVAFLHDLVASVTPRLVLIRVPLFERHWHLPMRRELGVNYFSDPTHFIEHRVAEFAAEMADGGLEIIRQELRWGEIWAVCAPRSA